MRPMEHGIVEVTGLCSSANGPSILRCRYAQAMELVWSLIGIVVTAVLALIAISQSRKYQNRPDLFVTWDRVGLAGGIE
jgi:hypothetical protein